VIGMRKCWGDLRRPDVPSTPGALVVDVHHAHDFDVFGQMLLWPPKYTNEWPAQAALLECGSVGGPPDVGFHPPHPVVASWMPTVPVVMSSMTTLIYGLSSTRMNGQCKRRDWDPEVLG